MGYREAEEDDIELDVLDTIDDMGVVVVPEAAEHDVEVWPHIPKIFNALCSRLLLLSMPVKKSPLKPWGSMHGYIDGGPRRG